MTVQASEILYFNGIRMDMCDAPLEDYFRISGGRPKFEYNCTALARGYIGTWEILDDRLYMIKFAVGGVGEEFRGIEVATFFEHDESPVRFDMKSIFPCYPDRVFADWYSGTLRVEQGELIKSTCMNTYYEQYLLINVDSGVVTGTEVLKTDVEEVLKLTYRRQMD